MSELERLGEELDLATMKVAQSIDNFNIVKGLYLDELDKNYERYKRH